MAELLLTARTRGTGGKNARTIRRTGDIPAVIYGHGSPTVSLEVSSVPFTKVWKAAGESTLIDLQIDNDRPVKALIYDVQYEPAKGSVLHVDFYKINMKEKIDVDISLHFVGTAPAVKELGGTFIADRATIKVECLPGDLVKDIDVDIGSLATFDNVLYVKDLVLQKGLTLKEKLDTPVAYVEAPRTEEEMAALEGTVEEDVSQVERVEKEKKEEETAEATTTPETASDGEKEKKAEKNTEKKAERKTDKR